MISRATPIMDPMEQVGLLPMPKPSAIMAPMTDMSTKKQTAR